MVANGILSNIREQMESCKALLSVFQDERKRYLTGVMPSQKELLDTISRKTQLVDMFDRQREILKHMEEDKNAVESVKTERKTLVRDLAAVLEQLLVIDHENERLLRELSVCSKPSFSSSSSFSRQRPALQRQLPLMPFDASRSGRFAPAAPVAPAIQRSTPAPVSSVQPRSSVQTPAASSARPVQPAPSVSSFVPPAAMPIRPKAHLRSYTGN